MGLANIGLPGIIVIFVLGLLIFGPKKIPQLGSAVGRMMSEFKKGIKKDVVVDQAKNEQKSLPKA
ncbi:twin-arginine translocase TatA/TatE family subunit [Bacillus sp. 1NLA3E]|uniref:twin-arginine translocase TatA/TatE family subunit n=1 Tax=Bacillus sp. 1NLA3E TaxID=666686 RepID=UPI000247ED5C|nr:twin-arginine translocase TatA/TatE family subunit [Bacillus sp. 1NLA3E]